MKNRRNIIVAFLLCATLIVGVGYAAFVDNLVINGSITYDPNTATEDLDEDITFTSVSDIENCEATIGDTGDTATMTVTFTAADAEESTNKCTAKATFTITNTSTTTAVTLEWPEDTHSSKSDVFVVTTDWDANVVVPAGGTATITVTVETVPLGGIETTQEGTFVVQLPVVVDAG